MGGKKKFNPMEFIKKKSKNRPNKKNSKKPSKESLSQHSTTSLEPTCSKYVDADIRTPESSCASSISSASIQDLVMSRSGSEHTIVSRSSYDNAIAAKSSSMAVIPGWFIDDDDEDMGEEQFCNAAENSKLISIARGDLKHSYEESIFMKDVLNKRMKKEKLLTPRLIEVKECRPHVQICPDQGDFEWEGFPPHLITKPIPNLADQPITITGRDSTTSSVVDFDELPKIRPWTPKPIESETAAPADPGPPKFIHYAFGEDGIKGRQHAENELSLYKYNKMYNMNVKQPQNPSQVPEKERQTIKQYVRSIEKIETSDGRSKIMKKMDKKENPFRVRRKIFNGSYPQNTVNENKMFGKDLEILRYTWKGKLIKLKKYLADSKNQKHINKQDKCGRTACHFAASWDCSTTLKVLLDINGVNPNLRDDEGKTPLYKAVEINSISCVKMLIEHGANPRIKAYDNRSPLEFAIGEMGDEAVDIIKHLFVEGKMSEERIQEGTVSYLHQLSFVNKDLPIVNTAAQLIEAGAFINATEGSGRTPLMLAAQRDRADLVEVFLRYKADANHIDMEFKTALHYARKNTSCYKLIKGALRVHTKSLENDRARTATLSKRR